MSDNENGESEKEVCITPVDEQEQQMSDNENGDEQQQQKSDNENGEEQQQHMSKNQLKKLRKKEKWNAVKKEKRKEERQKKKAAIAARKERGEELGPTRKKLKTNTMQNSSCKIQVAVDLSLDKYMSEKDMKSLTDQLRHCYSDNRRAENPLQLYFCGSSGKTMDRMEEIGDFKRWDVNIDKKSFDEVFPKDNLVYLTSESSNILSTLTEGKVYVIGGLVDHNRHKGLCHRLAEEKGIAHAQLPISEFFKMSSRKVLAVNHVFSILLKYTESNDWKQAFLKEMPQRKVADLKEITPASDKKDQNMCPQPNSPSKNLENLSDNASVTKENDPDNLSHSADVKKTAVEKQDHEKVTILESGSLEPNVKS